MNRNKKRNGNRKRIRNKNKKMKRRRTRRTPKKQGKKPKNRPKTKNTGEKTKKKQKTKDLRTIPGRALTLVFCFFWFFPLFFWLWACFLFFPPVFLVSGLFCPLFAVLCPPKPKKQGKKPPKTKKTGEKTKKNKKNKVKARPGIVLKSLFFFVFWVSLPCVFGLGKQDTANSAQNEAKTKNTGGKNPKNKQQPKTRGKNKNNRKTKVGGWPGIVPKLRFSLFWLFPLFFGCCLVFLGFFPCFLFFGFFSHVLELCARFACSLRRFAFQNQKKGEKHQKRGKNQNTGGKQHVSDYFLQISPVLGFFASYFPCFFGFALVLLAICSVILSKTKRTGGKNKKAAQDQRKN